MPDLSRVKDAWVEGAPVAAIVFYRALLQAGAAPVDAMIEACRVAGLNPSAFLGKPQGCRFAPIVADLLAQARAT